MTSSTLPFRPRWRSRPGSGQRLLAVTEGSGARPCSDHKMIAVHRPMANHRSLTPARPAIGIAIDLRVAGHGVASSHGSFQDVLGAFGPKTRPLFRH